MVFVQPVNMDKPAKKKWLCSYNKLQEANNKWAKPVCGDLCNLCCQEFSIGHGSENDLTQHASTERHAKATPAKGASHIHACCVTSAVETDESENGMHPAVVNSCDNANTNTIPLTSHSALPTGAFWKVISQLMELITPVSTPETSCQWLLSSLC